MRYKPGLYWNFVWRLFANILTSRGLEGWSRSFCRLLKYLPYLCLRECLCHKHILVKKYVYQPKLIGKKKHILNHITLPPLSKMCSGGEQLWDALIWTLNNFVAAIIKCRSVAFTISSWFDAMPVWKLLILYLVCCSFSLHDIFSVKL